MLQGVHTTLVDSKTHLELLSVKGVDGLASAALAASILLSRGLLLGLLLLLWVGSAASALRASGWVRSKVFVGIYGLDDAPRHYPKELAAEAGSAERLRWLEWRNRLAA